MSSVPLTDHHGSGRFGGRRPARQRIAVTICAAIVGVSSGCGLQIPVDPDGTLEDVSGGTIRVGYSPEPGLIEGNQTHPSGPVADIVERLGDDLDAEIDWNLHSEEAIISLLEEDGLDLGVGGFTDQTPWVDRVAVSRSYEHLAGAEGHSLVVVAQLGENAFLSRVEMFLDQENAS